MKAMRVVLVVLFAAGCCLAGKFSVKDSFGHVAWELKQFKKMLVACYEDAGEPCDWQYAGYVPFGENSDVYMFNENSDGSGTMMLFIDAKGCEPGYLVDVKIVYGDKPTLEITSDYPKCVELIKKQLK